MQNRTQKLLRLAVERQKNHWSQSELGRRSGVNQTTISAIESQRLRPWEGQLAKLSSALQFEGDPEDLLDEVQLQVAEVTQR